MINTKTKITNDEPGLLLLLQRLSYRIIFKFIYFIGFIKSLGNEYALIVWVIVASADKK